MKGSNDAIVPIIPTTNRRLKRKYVSEAKNVFKHLELINSTFLHYVFNAPDGVTYEELYQMFLEEWNFRVKWLKDNNKLKVSGVRPDWFEKEYRPRHREKS
jgi:hypothetical protein